MRVIDRRASNRMSIDTKVIHARLEAWAKWSHENQGDWPARTMLGRLVDGELPSTSARPPISMPKDIAAVDAAVGRLNPQYRRVIVEYYQRWEPQDFTARRLRMKLEAFKTILHKSRLYIAGYVAQLEEIA